MKYLKRYRIFESKEDDIKADINDILVDLVDKQYYVDIPQSYLGYLHVYIGLWKGKTFNNPISGEVIEVGELFTWDDIKESITRLFDYLDYSNIEYHLSMIDSGRNSHPFIVKDDDFVCIKDNGEECQKCKYQKPHLDLDKNMGSLHITIKI